MRAEVNFSVFIGCTSILTDSDGRIEQLGENPLGAEVYILVPPAGLTLKHT
jgi:hypothetical protein